MKQWKRYKSYILPYKSAFILGPLMMVTEVLGEILLPKFMSMIINHGVAQKDGGYILKMGLVMAITSFLMAAGGILGRFERYDEIYYRTAAEFAGIRGSDSRS